MSKQSPEDDSLAQFWLKARGINNEDNSFTLSDVQAQAILHSIGIEGCIYVKMIKEYNHVYQIIVMLIHFS